MILKKVIVENFRNIKYAELEFGCAVNIFYGDNAQGKTNLLEAISIALGKSFRNVRKSDLVPFYNNNAITRINLFYESEKYPGKINEISYVHHNVISEIKINSIPVKKATDLYGEFKYVVFIPDHLNLIKGYPDIRRYYLDNIAIMQNKVHRKFLNEYKDALNQRCSAILSQNYYDGMMQVWDDILIKQGINLTYGRLKYFNLIRQHACDIYKNLSGGEELALAYLSNVFGDEIDYTDFENKQNLYNIYKNKLSVNNEILPNKTPGSHKDDILFILGGNNARNYGSQGQLRSIAVSLKLAEAAIIREFNLENPVVLLDEVLGELDEHRRKFIIKHFVDSQVFITTCNISDFENISDLDPQNSSSVKIWRVEDGTFTISASGE